MAATGPVADANKLTITSATGTPFAWAATVSSDAPWLVLSKSTGTTPAEITLSVADFRASVQPPGTYTGKITITANDDTKTEVAVSWTVATRLPGPRFTYNGDVRSCTKPAGYPDDALCTVPEEKPPGTFAPPAAGGSYTDPNFGSTVKIVSGTGNAHTYSANNPLSANNKYLMLFTLADGAFDVWDVASNKIVFPRVSATQDFFWDSYNDSIYYYLRGSSVIQHDLSTATETTVIDFARTARAFTSIKRGGTSSSSKDNWISLFAPAERQVCTLDLTTRATYCSAYPADYGEIDYVLDAKGIDRGTGKRYVTLIPKNGALGVYTVNLAGRKLDLEYRGPEEPDGARGNHNGICEPNEKCMAPSHADTLEDVTGIQYLVFNSFTETPCELSTATYQFSKGPRINVPVEIGGGKRKVMSLWQCPFPSSNGGPDEHVGCAKNAPYCVISTVAPYRAMTDAPVRFPHTTEIMVMRGNGLEVRRLAQSRSVRFSEEGGEAYWAEPRAAISNDGSLVVSDSNFGALSGVRVTLIQTGFRTSSQSMAVLNSASNFTALAPGSYASILGQNLATCTSDSTPYPFPDTMCGARVTFGGAAARLSYVSPTQINFIVPQRSTIAKDAAVAVSVEGQAGPLVTQVYAESLAATAPSMFKYALGDGVDRAVIQDPQAVLNGPVIEGVITKAAAPGDTAVIYANGLGTTDNDVADGVAVQPGVLARTRGPVSVFINGQAQQVVFSGLAPGFPSLYQVNIVIHAATPILPDGQNFIWLKMGDAESQHLAISLVAK